MIDKKQASASSLVETAVKSFDSYPFEVVKGKAYKGTPVVFGGGWLGNKLSRHLCAVLINKSEADIGNASEVAEVLDTYQPYVVINAAGKTGRPNIDWCEDHKPETLYSNVTGPLVLFNECLKRGLYFVHLSSGCIYDGEGGYKKEFDELDRPNPVSYYGDTKAEIEKLLLEATEQIEIDIPLILRIRMPVDKTPHPRNLITKLTQYSEIIDVENSITVVDDFLNAAEVLIERRRRGVYNITNPGSITHQRIMELYKEIVDPDHEYTLIDAWKLETKAGRSNCILNSSKLKGENIPMRNAEEAIIQCLKEHRTLH